jgi:hypothetical protein
VEELLTAAVETSHAADGDEGKRNGELPKSELFDSKGL